MSDTARSAGSLSPADLLFADFELEFPSTRRTLQSFPPEKADWRPHGKSTPLAQLATHLAALPAMGAMVLTTNELDIMTRKPQSNFTSSDDLVGFFDSNVSRLREALAKADLDSLNQKWKFRAADHVVFELPRRIALRILVMNHHIHHRAQLGVYYRLLDIPVPGVYGPTADE